MSQATLKLAEPIDQGPADVLRFERRRAERHYISGRVTAVSNGGINGGPRNRITPLQLLNLSDTGVAAIAQEQVPVDSLITIFFPPHGPERGFDAVGKVVRCRPYQHGHEIGIVFDRKPAA